MNRKLAGCAAMAWKAAFPEDQIDRAEFRDFEMPVYDGDLEDREGMPKGAEALVSRMGTAEAILIATPEYNGGIPGALKNALDWVSRADENPLAKKPVLLLGASPGGLGAVRGLWHTRVPFEALGGIVYPTMFGLPKAGEAFGPDDRLVDLKTAERLARLVSEFREFARRQAG